MPNKLTFELIINDKAFYEYETTQTIEKYIVDFRKFNKNFFVY